MTSKHPETIVLHAGHRRDSATNAVAVPIYPRRSMAACSRTCTESRGMPRASA